MMEITIARRYALSLLELADKAEKEGQEGIIQQIESGLIALKNVFLSDPKFADFLTHPRLARRLKKDVLAATLKDKVPPLLLEFLNVLVDKRRCELLPYIADAFDNLADQFRGVVRIQVDYSHLPSPQQMQKLKVMLQEITKPREVDIRTPDEPEPELIGGMRIKYINTVADGTVKTALKDLRRTLLGFYEAMVI